MKLPFGDKFLSSINQTKILQFADELRGQTRPDESEKTGYRSSSYLSYGGISYNPDTITIETYNLMRLEGQINMGLQFCKLPIMALDYSIDCEDKDIGQATFQEIQRIYRSVVEKMTRALDFGFSVMEKVWEYQKDTGLWGYKKLKDPEISTIELKIDDKGNFNGFRQEAVDIEAEKSFVFVHRMESGNYYGIPRTKPAYPYYYAGNLMLLFANRYMERNADPFKVIRYPKDNNLIKTKHPNLDRATTLIEQIKGGSGIALPNDVDATGNYLWDIKYIEDTQRGAQYLNYMNFLNTMKLRSIIVPERTATQDASTGSYAMAEAHTKLFLLAEEGLIADIEDAINKYLIPQFVEFNFGETAPKATLDIAPIQDEQRIFLEEIIKDILRNPMVNVNEYISIDKIRQRLGLPEPEEEPAPEAEHKHKHNINLERNKFWRESNKFEAKVDLPGIDKFLDEQEEKLKKQLAEVMGWMRESAIRYLMPIIENKDIKGINAFVLKYKNDFIGAFNTNLWDCFDGGIKSVIQEFRARLVDKSIPQKETQWLNGRASSVGTKCVNDIQYKIESICLTGIDARKDSRTIILEINNFFSTYQEGVLLNTIGTECVTALNRGRTLAADTLAGIR